MAMENHGHPELDLKGMACPQPVVETRRALLELEEKRQTGLTVIVDNPAAAENVTRFALSRGWEVAETVRKEGNIELAISRGPASRKTGTETRRDATTEPSSRKTTPKTAPVKAGLVYLNSDQMGRGDEKLGRILIRAFLQTLPELENLPATIILVNRGVLLATEGSAESDCLKELAEAGCEILVCGTCLDFYHLKDELAVGRVSNMFEIAAKLAGPEPVIRP